MSPWFLLNRTANSAEYIARERADQSDRANRYRENDIEGHCALSDIMAFFRARALRRKLVISTQYELLETRALEHSDCPIHDHGTMAHPCLKPTEVTDPLMTKVTND